MHQEIWSPPDRAGVLGDDSPPGKFEGSRGQRPPGNILVFRMLHILVDATACGIGLADYAPTLPPDEALPIAIGLMTNFAKVVSRGAGSAREGRVGRDGRECVRSGRAGGE